MDSSQSNNPGSASFTEELSESTLALAVKKDVYLGQIPLTAYQLPSGRYVLASISVTSAINKHRPSLFQFLGSKSLESLSCKEFSLYEIPTIPTQNSAIDIKPVPLYVAIAYWSYWAHHKQRNYKAAALIKALATGHLITLIDDAYGVQRTPSERQNALAQMLHPSSSKLAEMGAQVRALSLQLEQQKEENTQLESQVFCLQEGETELKFRVGTLEEDLVAHDKQLRDYDEKRKWALNMEMLAKRKVDSLEKQVEQLTVELRDARATISACRFEAVRDAEALTRVATQLLHQRQAAVLNETTTKH